MPMTASKEQDQEDDAKSSMISSSPSSSSSLIQEAAEKCVLLDPSVLRKSDFVLSSFPKDVKENHGEKSAPVVEGSPSLRVCCYGSSSSQTPLVYMQEAATLGFLLAIRGHVCVNGAGSFGCMAAMNDGAAAGNGHIVGVIHEMWLVDGPEKEQANNRNGNDADKEWKTIRPLRDGGAHRIFEQPPQPSSSSSAAQITPRKGPRREMLVAGGKDLQERKRLLVDQADALIVLPGGPGTWDELWEMACARNIGLTQLPIVCVNTNGYYEPFKEMLQRAWEDQLTKLEPHQIVHFSETAQEAVQWVEEVVATTAAAVAAAAGSAEATKTLPTLQKRNVALRKTSVLGRPVTDRNSSSDDFSLLQSIRKSVSNISDLVFSGDNDNHENDSHGDTMRRRVSYAAMASSLVFCAGVAVGFLLSEQRQRESSVRRLS